MIKYYYIEELNFSNKEIMKLRGETPLIMHNHITFLKYIWTIPPLNGNLFSYLYHNDNGPAIIFKDGKTEYYWYDYKGTKEEYYDKTWRRKIESIRFL